MRDAMPKTLRDAARGMTPELLAKLRQLRDEARDAHVRRQAAQLLEAYESKGPVLQ